MPVFAVASPSSRRRTSPLAARVLALAGAIAVLAASLVVLGAVAAPPSPALAAGTEAPCLVNGVNVGDSYVVPNGVSSVVITVIGENGIGWTGYDGTYDGTYDPNDPFNFPAPHIAAQSSGGLGAWMVVTLPVTPGETLHEGYLEGGIGGASPGLELYQQLGLNGFYPSTADPAGHGGSAAFVSVDLDQCGRPVAIAAGGGGGGAFPAPGSGGAADIGQGAGGGGDSADNSQEDGGGGGGASAGGGGGGGAHGHYAASSCHDGNDGQGGALMSGGAGADGDQPVTDPAGHIYCDGGGGGGGGGAGYYYGGGGGSGFNHNGSGGGGGGESFHSSDATLVSETAGPSAGLYGEHVGPEFDIEPVYTTTTTIIAGPNPSFTNYPTVLTADVVNSQGTPVPGGSVDFYDGASKIGTSAVSDGVATLTTSSLGEGTHSMQAQFLGYHTTDSAGGDAPSFTQSTDVGGVTQAYQLRVDAPPAPPTIQTPPGAYNGSYGGSFSAAVLAGGVGPFGYEWQYSSTGAAGTWVDVDPAQFTETHDFGDSTITAVHTLTMASAGYFRVIVTNPGGSTTSTSGHLTVRKGDLVIVANDESMLYGGTPPALSYTVGYFGVGGFANGDTLQSATTGTLSCATMPASITSATPVGSYPIDCSGLSSSLYDISYHQGTFRVSLLPQTISFTLDQTTDIHVGDSSTLHATGGESGKPVTFTVDGASTAGACTATGTRGASLSFTGAGTCVVDADQDGVENVYAPAPQVQQTVTVSKIAQMIQFAPPQPPNYVDQSYPLTATGGDSGHPVTFSYAGGDPGFVSGACTLSGTNNATVTINHALASGCVITAWQEGAAAYADAAPVTVAIASVAAGQTIGFLQPPTAGHPGDTEQVEALGGRPGSELSLRATPDDIGVCTVSFTAPPYGVSLTIGSVTYLAPGTCTVVAHADASADYLGGETSTSASVSLIAQDIAFTPPANVDVGSGTLSATGGPSGGPVVFRIDAHTAAGVCGVSGTNGAHIDYLAPGSCVIDAEQAAVGAYAAASAQATVAVGAQAISFTAPSTAVVDSQLTLSATGGASGNPVVFAVDRLVTTGGCVITPNSDVVTFTGAGTCVVEALQAGNATHSPAPAVHRAIAITPAPQTIDFATVTGARVGGSATLSAAGGRSGNPVSFGTTSSACTVSGGVVSFSEVGDCIVTASQDASANYLAGSATQTIGVGKGVQVITFWAPTGAVYGDRTQLDATGGASGTLVVYRVEGFLAPCTITGDEVSYIGVGTCTIDADQAGNADYDAAARVSRTFTIVQAPLLITAGDGSMVYGTPAPIVTPSYDGFVSDDTEIATVPRCMTAASSTSHVGSYATTCADATDPDYAITYAAGTVTVTPTVLQVEPIATSSSYGAPIAMIAPSYRGFVNTDSAADLASAPTCVTAAAPTDHVGAFDSHCGGGSDPNYTMSYAPGGYTIAPAPLTVTASNVRFAVGTRPPAVAPIYAGLVAGETSASLASPASCSAAASASSPAGSYVTSCSGASDPDYAISYVMGTAVITAATATGDAHEPTAVEDPVPGTTPPPAPADGSTARAAPAQHQGVGTSAATAVWIVLGGGILLVLLVAGGAVIRIRRRRL